MIRILAIEDNILISGKFQIEITTDFYEDLVALVQQIVPLSIKFGDYIKLQKK